MSEKLNSHRLRSMRGYRGLTLEEAARRIGNITKQGLHDKEENEGGIKLRDFIRIAEVYNFRLMAFPEEQLQIKPAGEGN